MISIINETLAEAQKAITILRDHNGMHMNLILPLEALMDAYEDATGERLDPDEYEQWLELDE